MSEGRTEAKAQQARLETFLAVDQRQRILSSLFISTPKACILVSGFGGVW